MASPNRAILRNVTAIAQDVTGRHGETVHIAAKQSATILKPDDWFAPGQYMQAGIKYTMPDGTLTDRYPLAEGDAGKLSPSHVASGAADQLHPAQALNHADE